MVIIEEILDFLKKDRQIMLFSATFPISVREFKEKHMPDCKTINFMDELTLKGVTQYYAYLDEKLKVQCLNHLAAKVSREFQLTTTLTDVHLSSTSFKSTNVLSSATARSEWSYSHSRLSKKATAASSSTRRWSRHSETKCSITSRKDRDVSSFPPI